MPTATTTITEEQLGRWTSPAFDNEDAKAENTEKIIREAIAGHSLLSALSVRTYAKGSYKNNTNVRRDSDVDIAVEYTGIIYSRYGPDTDAEAVRDVLGTTPYSGPFRDSAGNTRIGDFKDAVGQALTAAFGAGAVTRSNKVFTVRESSRSLAADVVPCTQYRKYWSPRRYNRGIRLLPDRSPGHWIVNYPQQHYENGIAKNEDTSRRFKRVVRILKNLENYMVAEGASPEVASYLIESLVFNCPDACFEASTWAARVQNVLVHIWEDIEEAESEQRWKEVNDLKFLFHSAQRWTREDARAFAKDAWQYVKDL
jgi:hypothetical protein